MSRPAPPELCKPLSPYKGRHTELVEGKVRGAGLVYFVPKKTKFWTLKDSFVDTRALMCNRCGAVSWFGDTSKLAKLRLPTPPGDKTGSAPDSEHT